MTPNAIASTYEGKSPAAHKLAREWHEEADITRAYLDKAERRMKKRADSRRRHVEYKEGDQVMVKLLPQQFKTLRKVHKGLVRQYEGPFEVVRHVGKVSYQLQLPPRLKIHPIFHISLLKPYYRDAGDPSRGESRRALTAVVTAFDKDVEYILTDRVIEDGAYRLTTSTWWNGRTSPRAKQHGSAKTTYGNSRNMCSSISTTTRRGRHEHRWGRIITSSLST